MAKKKYNTESAIELLQNKFGDKYDYSEVKYINADTPITVICKEHNVTIKNNLYVLIKKDNMCPTCNRIKSQQKKLIAKLQNKFGDKYDYSKVRYTTSDGNAIIICPKHGEFKIRYVDLPRHNGCNKCRLENNSQAEFDKWLKEVKEIHKDKFDYSKVKYSGSQNKIILSCSLHGEFETTPEGHRNKSGGCKKCRYMYSKESASIGFNEIEKRSLIIHNSKYTYINDNNAQSHSDNLHIVCPEHGDFIQLVSNHLDGHGCPKCITKTQSKIAEYIESLGFEIKYNYRLGLGRQEVDIFIPSKNIAIEYHGLVWHSYGTTFPNNANERNPNIDKIKYDYLAEQGIQLITIWDIEWNNFIKQKIWISLLRNKLGLISKDNIIGARKCEIREVSNADSKDFLEHNHLQGNNYSKVNLGLYYQDNLMALMTFKKDVTHRAEYELVRFCNKINYQVQGGASKLLKYFERNYNPNSILSYANKRWSDGNLYNSLNFEFVKHTDPSYFYYLDLNKTIHSRNSFQKHMLKNKLEIFDEDKTEMENMFDNKYRILYDAGNFTYIKKY